MPGSLADPALAALYASVCVEDVEALYQGLVAAKMQPVPARPAPEGARPSPLGSLIWRFSKRLIVSPGDHGHGDDHSQKPPAPPVAPPSVMHPAAE